MKGQGRVGFAIRSYIGRSRTSSSISLLAARWRTRAEATSRLTNFTPIATGCVPLPRKTRRHPSASPVKGGWEERPAEVCPAEVHPAEVHSGEVR